MKSLYIKLIGPVVSLMLITGNVLGQTNGLPPQVLALQVAVSNLQTKVTALQATNGIWQAANSNLLVTVSNLQFIVKGQGTNITNLQLTVNNQGTQNGQLQNTVNALTTSNNDLSNRLQYVYLDGHDMYITNANLHIENGLGWTSGNPDPNDTAVVNGLGNLIVGYNELRSNSASPDDRSGSHNIVVGAQQNFSSYGGLVAGNYNTISGPYASVSGGHVNTASWYYCSVSGGENNTASGGGSSVSGGG
jgi:hypothetical protein